MNIFNIFENNEREIKKLKKIADKIEALEASIKELDDYELRDKTEEFRNRLRDGETLDDILPEAFAVVREAAVRTIGERHFYTQLIGGIVLHQGRIAEMKTGEGKTLAATLPSYLNALEGKGVHVVTVNDYLARRDAEWMGKIHRFLGLSVGIILHDMEPEDKLRSYSSDITYGTNSELGFDYLRDNMVVRKADMVMQRPFNYAIVDEVDSILIDEARTPLIISGSGDKSTEMYTVVDRAIARLDKEDYAMDEKANTINLTEEGVKHCEKMFNVENLTDPSNNELTHYINQALRANFYMKRDKDYVVKDGQVLIVDEFTGRIMTGRRYSDGLHQAIEAKERVKVERESKTLATITYQNFFRMYKKLAGMTGTAKTEEPEFRGIYGLDVVTIPTNKPMIRKDNNDQIYRTEKGKFLAVLKEVKEKHETGQPVLVGTVTVENSEKLSELMRREGINHVVLNAKFHEKEAEIVAQAGKLDAVTIATNMAGRGTDILLGGNPDFLTRKEMRKLGYEHDMIEAATSHEETKDEEILKAREKYKELRADFKKDTDAEHEKVVEVGGLHIVGTERHESRRIDNQLRGRSGRQGDPGSSRFFISMEDDLMRIFGTDRVKGIVERLGIPEDQPIEASILSKQIENAQKRIEGKNFDIRKNVLEYDDVMNKQREIIYQQRKKVLEGEDMRKVIMDMIDTVISNVIDSFTGGSKYPEDWNLEGMIIQLEQKCLPEGSVTFSDVDKEDLTKELITERILNEVHKFYEYKEQFITQAGHDMREIERVIVLRSVDRQWMDHIDAMDQLRDGIGLRAYGQKDPVVEYKLEGYDMFQQMIQDIQEMAVRMIFAVDVEHIPVRRKVAEPVNASQGKEEIKKPEKKEQKVGRNAPCICGSGKKYKDCCEGK